MKLASVEIRSAAEMLINILEGKASALQEMGTAIMLSGGVDSSLLFSIYGRKVVPFTLFHGKSADLEEARFLCSYLDRDLVEIEITKDEIMEAAAAIKHIDPSASIIEISFEIPFYVACNRIPQERIMTGQGADEIFYGYRKFRDGREDSNWISLETLRNKTLPREIMISSAFGKVPLMPYMDEEIIREFSSIPRVEHMNQEYNKIIVRKACEIMGIPERIYNRPKKAAQYGSGIMKVLREFRGEINT